MQKVSLSTLSAGPNERRGAQQGAAAANDRRSSPGAISIASPGRRIGTPSVAAGLVFAVVVAIPLNPAVAPR